MQFTKKSINKRRGQFIQISAFILQHETIMIYIYIHMIIQITNSLNFKKRTIMSEKYFYRVYIHFWIFFQSMNMKNYQKKV